MFVDVCKGFCNEREPFRLRTSFSLPDRGIGVFFGASGSGKTLTLNCIAGLVTPDSGRVTLGSRVLYDSAAGVNVPARLRRVGYMVQDYALFPHLSVEQNVAFGLTGLLPWHLSRAHREKARALLDLVGIAGFASSLPGRLSGGQRQRVALARALCIGPDLLLLDEPFSALDPLLRRRLRPELRALLEKLRLPSIIISHDPEDVAVFADTLILYRPGQSSVWPGFDRTSVPPSGMADLLLAGLGGSAPGCLQQDKGLRPLTPPGD